ncbi:MAG: hypothetical protein F4140_02310 [Cenarchaeum sp. SB0675_bin_21]|nr:hypothetical protein [Cenarchaeum sp. SB0675_bin_21]
MKTQAGLLAIMILTGASSLAFADNHNIPPITFSVNAETYEEGDTITISGTIKDVDSELLGAVVAQIISPTGNRVGFSQTVVDVNSGDFRLDITAGGPLWSNSGDYTILLTYNANDVETTISYVRVEPEPEPVLPNCGEGTMLVGDTCEIIPPEPEPEPVVVPPPPPPPEPEPEPEPIVCGEGTQLVDGKCEVIPTTPSGGSCLIATAAFGTELAPQVQYLREIRDNTLLSTSSGDSFMTGFNQLYYTISPPIADLEREYPAFRELVSLAITPMLASLSIMSLAEEGSEVSVLAFGIGVIALNVIMYVLAPTLFGVKAYRLIRTPKTTKTI